MKVKISEIQTNGGTQSRAEIDDFKVDEYAEDMEAGQTFPPVTLFFDGSVYWLADGFHRLKAAKKLQWAEIEADVLQGTQREAILFSVGANATHGLRRTNEDKRRAIMLLLNDSEWMQWSDSEIARRCKVGHSMVSKWRRSLSTVESENNKTERTYTTKHGTQASMKVSNIGQQIENKKEYVYEKAPEFVKEAVLNEVMTPIRAYEVTMELEKFPIEYREKVVDLEGDNVEGIQMQYRLYKSAGSPETNGTFEEMMLTGGFHYGEKDEDWCDWKNSSIQHRQRCLDKLAQHHRRIAQDASQMDKRHAILKAPEEIYSVIYADPAWQYSNSGLNGAAEKHYSTMPTSKICTLLQDNEIKVQENAVLFMWTTNSHIPDALEVIKAWGFEYKANFVWVKDKPAFGKLAFYNRGQHELLFLATKGKFTPFHDKELLPVSIIEAAKGEHSAKPDETRDLIESLYPEQRYLELFARNHPPRNRWTFWGNEEAEVLNAAA